MNTMTEQRGRFTIHYYSIDITDDMKQLAMGFATKIILSNNQYSRLLPAEVRNAHDITAQHKIEIQRTYMGKLGELAFTELLHEHGKQADTDDMFKIYPGQNHVDSFDFKTKNGKLVDVKTAFRTIHKRLLVNTEQFDHIPKDYYVAVKIDAVDIDSKNTLVDWEHLSTATILGYAEHSYIRAHADIYDFGEGNARWLYYSKLMGIDRLINMF